MFRKSQFILVLSLILLVVVIAACSESNGDEGDNSNSSAGESVEISVWLTPQWQGVLDPSEDGADYDSFFNHAAERFADEYDKYDVKVNVEVVAGDQRDELLNVNLNGGTPPDIFFESTFAMEEYAHRGALLPLTDIIEDEAKTDISETYWENVTFGDDIYFYPFSHMPGTLVYNADMLSDAGLDLSLIHISEPTRRRD